MNKEQKEAWMLGYQEGYSEGYDEGCEKGYEEGYNKRRHFDRTWLEFLKVKCKCGHIIPHPIFRAGSSAEFQIPGDENRQCPACAQLIPKHAFAEAYSEHTHTH